MNHDQEHAQRQANLAILRERRDALHASILENGNKIRRIVQKDIKRYLERETRARWIQHVGFASSMDDDTLAQLKRDLHALAAELQPTMHDTLGDNDLWIPDALPDTPTPKSLQGNSKLFTALQTIACKLSTLLSTYSFPADPSQPEDAPPYDLVYRTPAYFVDGLYCPGLIETYWTSVGQLLQVQAEMSALEHEQQQKDLELRWASF